jgi:multidrug efflux system outer membrane protein
VILRWGACATLVLSLGCAVGPNYRRPELPTTATFRDTPEQQASMADLPWWEVFKDDVLQGLIREALANNHDLQTAVANVEQARDSAAVQRGELFPQAGYDAEASRGKQSFLGGVLPGPGGTHSSYLALLNVAWEIDVWGRIRRATEAARAQMLATDAVRRGVVLSLVTGVAQAYLELRELDLELEISERNVKSFQETYELFTRQYQGGVASLLDPLRGEAALAQVAATVPLTEERIVEKENQLAVLVGRPPGPIPRGIALSDQALPPDVPAGIPSQLLERRPDLIEAEQNLVAANAEIGAAFADFFPRIGLTTAFRGGVSSDLSQILKSGAETWAVAGQALGPIFTFGQTWYTWEAAKAADQASVFQYQQTVLTALSDVSDALTAREKIALQRDQLEREVKALTESVHIAKVRYVGGLSTYVEVLDAEQQLFPAEIALAEAERDQLLAVVQLYKALGGGWNQDGAQPSIPTPLRP